MKSVIRSFSSVKLAIVLLIIITIASVLGTFIPQQRSSAEYVSRYGQMANILIKLEFTTLYRSHWFISLLILFGINIIVCTLTRLSQKVKRAFSPQLKKKEKEILVLKTKEKIRKKCDPTKIKDVLKKEFSSKHYHLREEEKENRTYILARKKILGLFGADIVHFGILIILAGGIVSGLGGFRKNLSFSEGEISAVPKANFKLRLDKFETEYYPNGSVRDWKSTLTIIENEKPKITKIIEVNKPLSYKGFVFYQSSCGWDWKNSILEILVKKRSDPAFSKEIRTKLGEKVSLEEENIQISVLHFIPDFVVNEKNEIFSRSLQPNNPAVFLEGWHENEKIFSGWIFARFPDVSRIHSEKETDLHFELKDFKANQFSVIQAAKDPGVNFIWLGSVIVMIGLFLAFYWPTREIRMILEESNGGTEIIAGGIAAKNPEALQSDFKEMMSSIRRTN